jgi:A/G-specific adenine glycosylase
MDESDFSQKLLSWFDRSRRELPWRLSADAPPHARLNPYHVLVSEAMLQQTQVATVIDYFRRFIARFPTIQSLAEADPQEVLRLWQGLGYYSRARNLQAAARAIVAEHGGKVPDSVEHLLELPGIGRYTAGAVASIAFERPAPIVDGNVARVLCRLEAVQTDPRDKSTQAWLWKRAGQILPPTRIGDFNSALMELGALVCTPRAPKCLLCPVQSHCQAFAAGLVEQIPPPRKRPERPLHRRQVFAVSCDGKYLLEQRPAKGRWAGMWQFTTLPWKARRSLPQLHQQLGLAVEKPHLLGEVEHGLTHRQYHFQVLHCQAAARGLELSAGRVWVGLEEISRYPLSRPHLKVAQMLAAGVAQPARRRRGKSSLTRLIPKTRQASK